MNHCLDQGSQNGRNNEACHFVLCDPSFGLFRRVRKYEKSDFQLRHIYPSVCPHGTTRLPLDGF
jgi:hypothetical protein